MARRFEALPEGAEAALDFAARGAVARLALGHVDLEALHGVARFGRGAEGSVVDVEAFGEVPHRVIVGGAGEGPTEELETEQGALAGGSVELDEAGAAVIVDHLDGPRTEASVLVFVVQFLGGDAHDEVAGGLVHADGLKVLASGEVELVGVAGVGRFESGARAEDVVAQSVLGGVVAGRADAVRDQPLFEGDVDGVAGGEDAAGFVEHDEAVAGLHLCDGGDDFSGQASGRTLDGLRLADLGLDAAADGDRVLADCFGDGRDVRRPLPVRERVERVGDASPVEVEGRSCHCGGVDCAGEARTE